MTSELGHPIQGLPWRKVMFAAIALSCRGPADLVASSSGDYDPDRPPRLLELSGDLAAHNPVLTKSGETYYVYYSGVGLLSKHSSDLRHFREGSPIFSETPTWVEGLIPNVESLWSPTIARFGGKIHLYYAASNFGSTRSCIGHAVTSRLEIGFVDQGPVVCSNVSDTPDDYNAIDPEVLVDGSDGEPWMVFGSFGNGLHLIALNQQGERLDDWMTTVARRSADNPAIQAAALIERSGYYYLFASFDSCCNGADSDYHIMLGRADRVTGPYLDREGIDLVDGGGTLVLDGGTRWRGPGSNMIFVEDRQHYNVYHAYDANAAGQATLRIAELDFDNEGWPVSAGP